MNIAIILAAGSGNRFKADKPKQFLELNGKAIFLHSIEKFLTHKEISHVILVTNPEHQKYYSELVKNYNLSAIITGGKRRQDSVLNAIEHIKDLNPHKILIHDAARPFLSHQLISDVLAQLESTKTAIVPAIKARDSLRQIGTESKSLEREKIYQMQTPQGFYYDDLCYLQHKYNERNITDEASFYEFESGYKVKIITGENKNNKITYQDDLNDTASFCKNLRIGFGTDIHAYKDHICKTKIKIGGVEVEHNHEIIAHSDGDVVLHALVDAMLGAASLGDIGEFFPDSDPKFKNQDSSFFVKIALEAIRKRNFSFLNIDITIICETPKLKKYKEKIENNIASLLAIDKSQINVKAKTNEKLDAIGKNQAIAAYVNILGILN